MKVKATKTMAEMLNKKINKYHIYQAKMTLNQYEYCVDIDALNHENDYDWNTRKFSVIVVEYPQDYYANNRYLTTNDLLRAFKRSNKTLDDFVRVVKEEIEV